MQLLGLAAERGARREPPGLGDEQIAQSEPPGLSDERVAQRDRPGSATSFILACRAPNPVWPRRGGELSAEDGNSESACIALTTMPEARPQTGRTVKTHHVGRCLICRDAAHCYCEWCECVSGL